MVKSTARVKGPRTVYGPKVAPAESCLLTDLGKRILAGADARTGVGKSNVVEHLLRLYGGSITASDFVPVVEGAEEQVVASVQAPPTPRRRASDSVSA